ncbi:MAG: phosphate/phosphite/phosphonate ABC transporter substrate-binding protein [Bacillota bacterium]
MRKIIFVLLVLTLFTSMITGCGNQAVNNSTQDVKQATTATQAKEVKKLVVALLPDESPSTVIKNNEPLKEYLQKTLNIEIELIVTTDYSSMIESMRKGHIDIGYFGPLSYVLLKQKMENVVPFAAKLDKGEPTYHAVVIAGTETGIKTLADIKGKTVAYGDVASTSSHLIPKEMIKAEGGLASGEGYKEQFVGAHDAVAMAVQNGNAQAGGLSKPIFDSLIEKGTIDPKKVKEIALSKPYPNYPWAMRTDLPAELQEQIKKAFYDLKDKEILKILKAEGFAPIADKDYDVIRNMVKILGINLEEM